MDFIRSMIPNIHREGYVFIIIFMLVSFIFGMISDGLGWLGILLTIWCIYFFRDPERITPKKDNILVSPADGVVTKIEEVLPPFDFEDNGNKVFRVSIFLSVFNVHVNRIPIAGTIKKLYYHPGKFFNASMDKASEHNERQEIMLETTSGKKVIFSQIAGLIARRIVCNLEEGQIVNTGDRFGIIRFGSRVDIYLPKNIKPDVLEGQTMVGGETIIAQLDASSTETTPKIEAPEHQKKPIKALTKHDKQK